jgi:branched-chain amino acid transport system permease protein
VSLAKNLAYYYFILAVVVIFALLLWGLLRSPWGKAFTALRDNPIRAESLGIDTRSYTLLAFAIGAAYAGVAGALYAPLVEYIEPAPFAVGISIMMYLMVVIGGPGYFLGPLLGAAVGVVVPEWSRNIPGGANWYLVFFGVIVMAMMVWLPDGLLSLPDRLRERREAKQASLKRAKDGAALVAPGAAQSPQHAPVSGAQS